MVLVSLPSTVILGLALNMFLVLFSSKGQSQGAEESQRDKVVSAGFNILKIFSSSESQI